MDPNTTNFKAALATRQTVATVPITLKNPLAGGSIYFNLSQWEWRF